MCGVKDINEGTEGQCFTQTRIFKKELAKLLLLKVAMLENMQHFLNDFFIHVIEHKSLNIRGFYFHMMTKMLN